MAKTNSKDKYAKKAFKMRFLDEKGEEKFKIIESNNIEEARLLALDICKINKHKMLAISSM